MKYLILFILIYITNIGKSQSPKTVPITFREYSELCVISSKSVDTIRIINNTDSLLFEIKLFDKKGACYLKSFNKKNKELLEEGNYSNSLGLLTEHIEVTTFIEPSYRDSVYMGLYYHYEPLRNGEWKVYKKNELFEIILYDRGIIRKRTKVK